MSTSISLGTSADLESLNSKINSDALSLRSDSPDNLDQEQHKSTCEIFKRQSYPFDWFRSNHEGIVAKRHHSGCLETQRARNFYQEVDERMSRNSFEYPDEQAKHVDNWLNDINLPDKSEEDQSNWSNWGKVIGIRGFRGKEKSKREARTYNELKFEFSKLYSDNEKLKVQLSDAIAFFKSRERRKNNDIAILKALIDRKLRSTRNQAIYCETCATRQVDNRASNVERADDRRDELRELEMKVQQSKRDSLERLEALKRENEELRAQQRQMREDYDKEMNNMRNRMKNLTLETNNRTLLAIQNENLRLKDLNEEDVIEFQVLKENYRQLESNFTSILEEQRRLSEVKNEENSNLLLELCRLQVYQPKLETLLKTERDIKLELQNKIKYLEKVVDNLREELKGNNTNLIGERLRSKKAESVELERLHQEVANWQEKYCRLEKEKADVENLLRNSRSKVSILETKFQLQLEQWKDKKHSEVERLQSNLLRLEEERNKLEIKVEELAKQLEVSTSERIKLDDEVVRLTKELQVAITERQSMGVSLKGVSEAQDRIRSLTDQLRASERQKNQLLNECELYKGQTERCKLQVDQLKQRIHLQQKAYDELRNQRDKELAKIRGSLKFEQYNRQVALKGIEKELRVSLGELEAMKYRFSQRLTQQSNNAAKSGEKNNSPTNSVSGQYNSNPIVGVLR